MESNSSAPVPKMNGKEKEMVHHKKWAFNWFMKFCRVSDERIVAGSLFHVASPATANARSPKTVFERGT